MDEWAVQLVFLVAGGVIGFGSGYWLQRIERGRNIKVVRAQIVSLLRLLEIRVGAVSYHGPRLTEDWAIADQLSVAP